MAAALHRLSDVPARRPALWADGRAWTYGELTERVDTAAAQIAADERSLVFLLAGNDTATVVSYLAAQQAGHAVALLDAAGDASELIGRYRPAFVIAPADAAAPTGYAEAGAVGDRTVWRRPSDAAPVHPDLSLLLTTSGSTGSPKFVRLSWENVASNARAIADYLDLDADERAVTSLPLHYTFGLSVLNSHLAVGASVVVTNDSVISPAFWETVRAQRCTSLAGVPYTYAMLRRIGFLDMDLPDLRTLTQAGGRLGDDAILAFHAASAARDRAFVVMYGQTEATARISYLPSSALPERVGSVGRAIPGGALRIEAPDADGVGEVVYDGPNVMMGYAENADDLVRGDDLGGTLHTGDLGRLDADGFLWITGRSKRIAKVFGLRINLDEVEAMLSDIAPVAAVQGDDKLVVFSAHADAAEQRRPLAKALGLHPAAITVRAVEVLPRTASGKTDYAALHAQIA